MNYPKREEILASSAAAVECRRLQELVKDLTRQNRTLRRTISALEANLEWKDNEKPWITFYFCQRESVLGSREQLDQRGKVLDFRERINSLGLVRDYPPLSGGMIDNLSFSERVRRSRSALGTTLPLRATR